MVRPRNVRYGGGECLLKKPFVNNKQINTSVGIMPARKKYSLIRRRGGVALHRISLLYVEGSEEMVPPTWVV